MGDYQILIKGGKNWFEFSRTQSGQLDYIGKVENADEVNVGGYQRLASSGYFSPSQYIFLEEVMQDTPEIFVSSATDIFDRDIYAFLLHIGALLCAVEAKDSLLAGELYMRRKNTFEKFPQLAQFIIKPLAAEMLFGLLYGSFESVSEGDVPVLFNTAKKILGVDESKETVEQAFVRYFRNRGTVLALPVVGTNHYRWSPDSETLGCLMQNISPENFSEQILKLRRIKYNAYANLETAVQAEPYNPADENAIAVMIENIDSKFAGCPGLEKAGYIRARAARIIRAAKPEKLSYEARLIHVSAHKIAVRFSV